MVSDVFISCTRENETEAKLIAKAIENHGWSVWWDRTIPVGRVFDEVIEEAIDNARNIIVFWSRHSVGSSWVKSEAEEGAERGVLIPILRVWKETFADNVLKSDLDRAGQ